MKFFFPLCVIAMIVTSCVSPTAERRAVLPLGSEESDMPWNAPRPGEGGGALGGLLGQQFR